jgi:hypothetical protein
MAADGDGAAEQFDIPGFYNVGMGSQGTEMGHKIAADIKVLEPVPGLFYIVWALISDHGLIYK